MTFINLDYLNTIISYIPIQKLSVTITLILILTLANKILHRLIKKNVLKKRNQHAYKRLFTNIIYGIGLISIALYWFSGIKSATTLLGFITAGLAFALRDIIADMASYVFVLFRRPFKVGDRIEIINIKGDVINIDWFQFTLLEIGNWVDHEQSTGRIIHIPMAKILTNPLTNYNGGFDWIWHEIKIVISYDSNLKKAKKLMINHITSVCNDYNSGIEKALKKALQLHLIEYTKVDPIIYTKAVDHGYQLTIRYFSPSKMRRETEEQFWLRIFPEFEINSDLEFADIREKLLITKSP